MATITKRNNSYRAEVRLSGHPYRSRTFASKRAAERWAAKLERAYRFGVKDQGRTLAQTIDAFLQSKGEDTGLCTHELNVLRWWRAHLGEKLLIELSRADFFKARDAIRGRGNLRLANATVNKRMALVASVLTWAFDRDWIDTYPARISRLGERNQRERLLTPDERAALLSACKASHEPALLPLVVCAMLSGARAGELVSLRWRDVDVDIGVARLSKTKTGVRRAVPLRGVAKDLLLEIADQTQPDTFVFRHAGGGAPFKYRRSWERARKEANLKDLHFHDLRHLAASELAMSGASARELQSLLGHASAQMTARYSHFIDDHTIQLGDRLSERIFGAGGGGVLSLRD